MGCGKSKDRKEEVNFDMEHVNISSIDSLCSDVAGPLQILKSVHDDVQNVLDCLNYETGVYWYLSDPNLEKSLKVFMFTASSGVSGDITQILKIKSEPPFLELEDQKLGALKECQDMIYWFKRLIEVIAESPKKIEPIMDKLKSSVESAKNLQENVKGEIESSSMNMLDKANATKKLLSNISKLQGAPEIAQKLIDDLKQMADQINNVAKWCQSPEGQAEIKKVGSQAANDKVYHPWIIITRYWPKTEVKASKPPNKKAASDKKK